MRNLTKAIICAAAANAVSIRVSDVELTSNEGGWLWVGKAGAMFSDMQAFECRLNDTTLERWVDDFVIKVEREMKFDKDISFQQKIDLIKWSDL